MVKGEDGTYTYTDDEETIHAGDKDYKVTNIKVTINGTAIAIEWKVDMGGFAITYTFNGDKNEKIVAMPSFANELIKSYKGVNVTLVGGDTSEPDSSIVKIFGQNNGKFTVRLPKATAKPKGRAMEMPIVDVKDVVFTEGEGKVYSASIDQTEVETPKFVVKVAKFTISVKGDDMDMKFDMQPGAMPMWISNTFTTKAPEKPSVDVTKIAASYYGDNTMKVGGDVMPGKNQVATIIAQENGKITLVLPEANKEQKARGMDMPTVEVKDIEVAEANGVYTFSLKESSIDTGKMVIKLKNLKGEVNGNILKLTFDMQPGAMPMWIANDFQGDKTGYKEPEYAVDAHQFEGNYVGDNKYSVMGSDGVFEKFSIKVVAKDNKTVSLHMGDKETKARGMELPPFAVEDVVLKGEADGSCSFVIEAKDIAVGPMTIKLTEVKGSIKGDKMNVTYKAQMGKMPAPIAFTYEGTKQTAPVDPSATAKEVLPGKYVGENSSEIAGESSKHAASMNVTAQEDGKFTIQVPEDILAEGEKPAMQMPTILVKDLEAVKGEDGIFTVTLDSAEFEVTDGKKATVKGLKATFAQDGKATLVLKLKYGKMPFELSYDFKGNKETK